MAGIHQTLGQIQVLVERGETHISLHGYDELVDDQISVRDVLGGLKDAILLEDYTQTTRKGLPASYYSETERGG